jgi:oligopeptide/dipeptide ABC transporter ATP-binding protein
LEKILEIKNLQVAFASESGRLRAVDGVSFSLEKGQTLGIVGESGCGKSVTCLSIVRLLPRPSGIIEGGEVIFDGRDLLKSPVQEMHKIRGNRIAMIFQEPMTALNPVQKVGRQIGEVFRLHFPKMTEQETVKASAELLEKVGIPSPDQRLGEYPHQLSGGMRQRVMIAMALACKPDILIADEPTTALDVTIQAQILELIQDLRREMGMSVIFVTHDLGVVAEVCDEVVVMYAGKVAEEGTVDKIFHATKHPYTQGLLSAIPSVDKPRKTRLNTIEGMVPSLAEMPLGCRFQNRCVYATELCKQSPPPLEKVFEHHYVSCFHWQNLGGHSD